MPRWPFRRQFTLGASLRSAAVALSKGPSWTLGWTLAHAVPGSSLAGVASLGLESASLRLFLREPNPHIHCRAAVY